MLLAEKEKKTKLRFQQSTFLALKTSATAAYRRLLVMRILVPCIRRIVLRVIARKLGALALRQQEQRQIQSKQGVQEASSSTSVQKQSLASASS